MHRNSILIRSNNMQQYAGIYLLQNHSTCFGCLSHPSSGVHKTVTAASGISHSIWATTLLRRGHIWPRFMYSWECDRHPKHVEWFAVNKYVHTVASRWILLTLILRRSRTGTVWFYTSTSNKRAARPKLYTKSLTRDLKLMYSRLKLVRISINL